MSLRKIQLSSSEQARALEQRLVLRSTAATFRECAIVWLPEGEEQYLHTFGDPQCTLQQAKDASYMLQQAKEHQAIKRGIVLGGKKYEINQHHPTYFAGRTATDGYKNAFVCLRSHDKLADRAVYTLAMFELPANVPEVLCELKSVCADVFEQGVLRKFF